MFHPLEQPLERGWVGRLDGDHVIQLAAQTLESFFTGGGSAREHAVYPLEGVQLLAPVLHPPSIRVFEDQTTFAFANPAAVVGPGATIPAPGGSVALNARLAAVVGADQQIAGFTGCADWRRGPAPPPKDRDFALGLGPTVITPDELPESPELVVHVDGGEQRVLTPPTPFEWEAARAHAAEGTRLRAGDLLAGPWRMSVDPISVPAEVGLEIERIGTLRQLVH